MKEVLFDQVRLSLGHYDASEQQWSVSVFFVVHLDQIENEDVPIVRVIAEDGQVSHFEGYKDTYEHTRDDRNSGDYANQTNSYYTSPWLCIVNISKLNPCQKVQYQVGIRNTMAVLDSHRFETVLPPVLGETCAKQKALRLVGEEKKEEMRIAVVGDIGQTEFSRNTRDYLLSLNKDYQYPCLLLVGDIAYADGDINRWDSWGRLFQPLTSILPLMTLPGNHETELDAKTGETFISYRKRFFMPSIQDEQTSKADKVSLKNFEDYKTSLTYDYGSSFYSFDIGKVHIVMLNTYDSHSYFDETTNIQQNWLESDLKSIDKEKTPFTVVCAHSPIYSTSVDHQNEFAAVKFKEWVLPLLNQFEVELYLSGHVHAYERIKKQNKTRFVTIGDGGNHEKLYDEWIPEMQEISEYKNGKFYGHGEIVVFNRTHMKWLFKPNPLQEESSEVLDEVMITSNYYSNRLKFEKNILLFNEFGILLFFLIAVLYVIISRRSNKKRKHYEEIKTLP